MVLLPPSRIMSEIGLVLTTSRPRNASQNLRLKSRSSDSSVPCDRKLSFKADCGLVATPAAGLVVSGMDRFPSLDRHGRFAARPTFPGFYRSPAAADNLGLSAGSRA